MGEIPKEDVALIREKADFDIDRILEIEQETRHDVVAFTRAVSETLGEERKWVHYGLTSTDMVDTVYGYLYKQANDIIRRDLENFTNIIADKAKEHKFTIRWVVPTVCMLSRQLLVLNWRLGTAK